MSMTFSHLICCLGYVHKGWSISSHLLTCVTALTSCGLSAATLEPLLSPRNKAAREILLKSRGIISLFDKLSTNSLAHSKEKLKSCQWSVLVWITIVWNLLKIGSQITALLLFTLFILQCTSLFLFLNWFMYAPDQGFASPSVWNILLQDNPKSHLPYPFRFCTILNSSVSPPWTSSLKFLFPSLHIRLSFLMYFSSWTLPSSNIL